ncbi:MAG: amino acid ABC transporter ATP-binding protein [[Clostridium] aminophilum]|uniref:amino acid ABC transporter ATP-binding protein n=1 Tax=[Clostridium] aminophilum TaxID=1526 RepID=UPI0026ED336E|nr:amino acid ABC transporter ATP-binding protein [[Clostridium] aminophilum]MDD6195329.1 amino acid ABC transporter ATP-binding protein [[Clostridium] aminophilum]
MLKLHNVHKSYGNNEILKGVDLEIKKGDIIVILGPSGSGKTTFLRTINYLERADQGTVDFDDIHADLKSASKKEVSEIRRRTGFVFQNYNLFANKTALENVTEGLIVARKIPKAQAIETAKKALERVGLGDRCGYYPSQLSGGQQQRVGIARAIAANPEVILFDEPTSALDPELVGEVLNVMKDLAKEGATMIVVTHEMSFAQQAATEVVYMEGGVVVEKGSPQEIFSHPKDEKTVCFLKRILRQDFDYAI